MISVSSNKCPSCSRILINKDEEEFCFYCEVIEKEDKAIQQNITQWIKDRKSNEKFEMFERDSIINPRLKQCTLENYKPENETQIKALQTSVNFIKEFSLDDPYNLLFSGSPGIGKSHLSASISKAIAREGYSSIFISVPKLMTKIKGTYSKGSEHSEEDLLKALEHVELLVLDDIGAENTKYNNGFSWAKTKIFEIIDNRIGKHTIYTTNFSGEELMNLYGERDFSRMVEKTKAIKITGKNHRLQIYEV